MNTKPLEIPTHKNLRASTGGGFPWQPRPAGCKDFLWRNDLNPIMGRNPLPGASCVYNSAVVPFGGAYAGVFRIDRKTGLPFLHAGFSDDGIRWTLDEEEIDLRDECGNPINLGYAYDPRVTPIEDFFVVAWCNDFHGPTIALAKTRDFRRFEMIGNSFLPFNRNGVLFPRRVDGKYVLLSRPSDTAHTPFGDIFLSQSENLTHWGEHRHVMSPGSGWWDSKKVGAGPVPIETRDGWLMIYHGVLGTCSGFNYSIGAALLDLDEPWKVIARADRSLLEPETSYEVAGRVPNVCFPCAALVDEPTGRLTLYYGAADTHIAVAHGFVDEIVQFVKTHHRAAPVAEF